MCMGPACRPMPGSAPSCCTRISPAWLPEPPRHRWSGALPLTMRAKGPSSSLVGSPCTASVLGTGRGWCKQLRACQRILGHLHRGSMQEEAWPAACPLGLRSLQMLCCSAAGGLGAVGSLVARWLARSSACHLWLLGRSGRAGGEDPVSPDDLQGRGLVTLARSDVSCTEEAAFVARAADRSSHHRLQVGPWLLLLRAVTVGPAIEATLPQSGPT